jgi:hypothetical protein
MAPNYAFKRTAGTLHRVSCCSVGPRPLNASLGGVVGTSRESLVLSLNRGLWGEVHPQLRQASIESDETAQVIRIRFEYDGDPSEEVRESCSSAATECIADFPAPWQLDEEHVPRPFPEPLIPLLHVVYLRAEGHVS